jgi:hypothetical protein
MDWIMIAVIGAIAAVLIVTQLLTGAGSTANKGMPGCMMPIRQPGQGCKAQK